MIGALFANLAILLYILGAAGYLVFIFRQNKQAGQGAAWMIRLGFVLQSISLILRTADLGQLPILNMTEALGFYGWAWWGFICFCPSSSTSRPWAPLSPRWRPP